MLEWTLIPDPNEPTSAYPASASTMISITTSNAFAYRNAPDNVSVYGAPVAFQFDTTYATTIGLSIVNQATGLTVRTLSQAATPGTTEIDWDLNDSTGKPAPIPGTYTVSVTTGPRPMGGPPQPPPAPPSPRPFDMSLMSVFPAGYTVVFRPQFNDTFGSDSMANRTTTPIVAAVQAAAQLHPNDPDGYARRAHPQLNVTGPCVLTQPSDFRKIWVITNLNTGHFYFYGHGNDDEFGTNLGDSSYAYSYNVSDVCNNLGNSQPDVENVNWVFRRRIRLTAIDTCYSGGGNLCYAFGTPRQAIDNSPNIQKSTFLGWTAKTTMTDWTYRSSAYTRHISGFEADWDQNGQDQPGWGIQAATFDCFFNSGDQQYYASRAIIGSKDMTWWKHSPME